MLTLGQLGTAAGRLAQNGRASRAHDNALGVAEHGGDLVAAGALHVHEVRVRVLHQALQLVLPLLFGGQRVQKVLSELHTENDDGGRENDTRLVKCTIQEVHQNVCIRIRSVVEVMFVF